MGLGSFSMAGVRRDREGDGASLANVDGPCERARLGREAGMRLSDDDMVSPPIPG